MLLNNYPTVAEATSALQREGFRTRLRFVPTYLLDPRSKRRYTCQQCTLLKYFRVPPGARVSEATTLYALLLPDGTKAHVVSNQRRKDGFQLAVFMDKMSIAVRATS